MNQNAYSEFAQLLKTSLEQSSTRGLFFSTVLKNNDTMYDTVSIKDVPLAPIAYLQEYFSEYENGHSIAEITDEILLLLNAPSNQLETEIPNLASYHTISPKILPALVNLNLNQERLKNIPYSVFLDLAVTYKIYLEPTDGVTGNIEINNNMMSLWSITLEQIHTTAMENLKNLEFSYYSTAELFAQMIKEKEELPPDIDNITLSDIGLVVLSSECAYSNGAIVLLSPDTFRKALDKYFPTADALLILPCSTHEVLVLPYPETSSSIPYFIEMLRSANQSGSIAPEEILNDENIYKYTKETNLIEIVKEQEEEYEEI